jgi:hypothetical protein
MIVSSIIELIDIAKWEPYRGLSMDIYIQQITAKRRYANATQKRHRER